MKTYSYCIFMVIQLAKTEDCVVSINAIDFQPFNETVSINPDQEIALNFELLPNW